MIYFLTLITSNILSEKRQNFQIHLEYFNSVVECNEYCNSVVECNECSILRLIETYIESKIHKSQAQK